MGCPLQNFFYKLRCALARFMYGRNGADQLCWAILIVELALNLLASLVRSQPFSTFVYYVSTFLVVYLFFRMFSRNLEKRRAENAKFMAWWGPKQAAFRGAKARRADKAHRYVKCSCGTWCRVPRNIGRVELRCPKCGRTHTVRT